MSSTYTVDVSLDPAEVMDALKEIEREAGVRRGVYPRWIESGKLNAGVAHERQHRMDAAAKILKEIATSMRQPYQPKLDLFKEASA